MKTYIKYFSILLLTLSSVNLLAADLKKFEIAIDPLWLAAPLLIPTENKGVNISPIISISAAYSATERLQIGPTFWRASLSDKNSSRSIQMYAIGIDAKYKLTGSNVNDDGYYLVAGYKNVNFYGNLEDTDNDTVLNFDFGKFNEALGLHTLRTEIGYQWMFDNNIGIGTSGGLLYVLYNDELKEAMDDMHIIPTFTLEIKYQF